MDSSAIFTAIEEIANTPGKNDKTALVVSHIKEEHFLRVLVYAYDPFKTYGVRQFLPVDTQGHSSFDDTTWQLLDDLVSRKLSGNAALETIKSQMTRLEPGSRELLKRIILKDLRAGFSENTINKARKGTIPTFPYMRCSLPKDVDLNAWPWDQGIISQEKADGMFVNVSVETGGVFMTTRQGTPLPSYAFQALLAEIQERFESGQQLHGEILVAMNGQVLPREIGNGRLNSAIQGGPWEEGCYPILKVWDSIPLSSVVSKGRCDRPYLHRLRYLHSQLKEKPGSLVSLIDTRVVRSLKEAYDHYREMLKQNKEGTIIKKPSMIWRDHTSRDQIKLKLEAPCELEVIGFAEGKGKHAGTFGALICQSACASLVVNVGTGLTDAQRLEIHNNRDQWLHSVITVKSNSIMYSDDPTRKPHSLFLPVFVERRLDKSEADDLPRIEAQFSSAIELVGAA